MALHIAHNAFAITIIGILGNIISGMVYLAPLPTYYRIYKKKSIQGFQSVPYVVALFSAMLWLYYGVFKKEYFLISINSVGCIVETLYIGLYYAYAPTKARICTAKLVFALNVGVFSMIVVIIQLLVGSSSNRIHVLGYICAIVSAGVFAAPLTIMMKVVRMKSVEFMPFPLSFFLTFCAVIWFAYGLLRQDLFISIPNMFGFLLGLLQMAIYAICKICCFPKKLERNVANAPNNVAIESLSTGDQHYQQRIYSEQLGRDQKSDDQDGSNKDHNKVATPDHAV